MELVVEATELIACPAEGVFKAWVDPARMSGYFISSGSEPMAPGKTVRWRWDDPGWRRDAFGGVDATELDIEVRAVEPGRRLSFGWSASGVPTEVTVELEPNAADNVTKVNVVERGWPDDAEGIARYGQQTRGWVHMLLCLKAYLEYERISLRAMPSRGDSRFELHLERLMDATPEAIYRAWTEQWDRWLAEPDALQMRPEPGAPFWFDAVDEAGQRHPHYGRFLRLLPDSLVEHTWTTAATRGIETQITVELSAAKLPSGTEGARLRLSHTGFFDTAARDRHEAAWPGVLAYLDACLAADPG